MNTINKPPENSGNIPRLENGFLHLAQIHNNHDTLIQQLAKITDDDLRQILNNPTLIDSSNQQLLKTITYNGNQLAIHQSVDFVCKALEAMAAKSKSKKKNNKFNLFKNNLRFGADHASSGSRINAHHFEKIIYECAISYINEIEINFNKSNKTQGNPLDKYFPNHTKVSDTLPPQNGTTLNLLLAPAGNNQNAQDDDGTIDIQNAIKTAAERARNETKEIINTLSLLIDHAPNHVEQFLNESASAFIEDAEAVKAYLNSNTITSEERTAILKVLHEHYNDIYSDYIAEEPSPLITEPLGKAQALAQLAKLTDLGSNPYIPAMTTPPEIGPATVGESNGIRTEEEEEEEEVVEEEVREEVKAEAKKPSIFDKFRKFGGRIAAAAAVTLGIVAFSSGSDEEQVNNNKPNSTNNTKPTPSESNTPTPSESNTPTPSESNTPTPPTHITTNNTIVSIVPTTTEAQPTQISYDLTKYNSGKYFVWHAIAVNAAADAELTDVSNPNVQKAIQYYYEQELKKSNNTTPVINTLANANPKTLTKKGHIPFNVYLAHKNEPSLELNLGELEKQWPNMIQWIKNEQNIKKATQFYSNKQSSAANYNANHDYYIADSGQIQKPYGDIKLNLAQPPTITTPEMSRPTEITLRRIGTEDPTHQKSFNREPAKIKFTEVDPYALRPFDTISAQYHDYRWITPGDTDSKEETFIPDGLIIKLEPAGILIEQEATDSLIRVLEEELRNPILKESSPGSSLTPSEADIIELDESDLDEIQDLTEFAEIIYDNNDNDIDNGWFELPTPQTNFSTINLEKILTGPAVDFSNIHLPLGTSKNAQSLAAILVDQEDEFDSWGDTISLPNLNTPTPNFSTIQFDTPFEDDTNWKLS